MAKRKMWWIADNTEELEQWREEFRGKDITITKVEPHPAPYNQIDVVFELEEERALELLGFTPCEESWLE